MTTTDENLDFSHYLEFYKNLGLLTGDTKRDAELHRKAEYMHSLYICDAVRDMHIDAVGLSQNVKTLKLFFNCDLALLAEQNSFGFRFAASLHWSTQSGLSLCRLIKSKKSHGI